MEIWKNIGYKNYEISNLGNLRNAKTGHIYTPNIHKRYLRICLDHCKNFNIHKLVALAFVKNTGFNPDGTPIIGEPQVNHINKNRYDNRAENLEWCDVKYNTRYSNNKSVINNTTGEIFSCITDAAKKYNLTIGNLWVGIKNNKPRANCYWSYYGI